MTRPGLPPPMVDLHTVAAFTRSPFGGNLAGVCLLDAPAPEGWMQAVAANVNLSETAFLHPEGAGWRLRWFTPAREVPLCGHATLASAHVLALQGRRGPFAFETRSGRLTCAPAAQGAFRMDFPADPALPCDGVPGLWEGLGATGRLAGAARGNGNLLAVFPSQADVEGLRPDFAALRKVPGDWGFIATAPAADGDGYVCRYFAPGWGIDEDPATGSIQCTLGPYWAERLGTQRLRCRQLSKRGAEMMVEPKGDRVLVEGTAVMVSSGTLAEAARPGR
jgi:predicted PhzF superfamily epimerase YddE/YHI9